MSREVKQTDLPPLPRSPRRDKIVVPKTSRWIRSRNQCLCVDRSYYNINMAILVTIFVLMSWRVAWNYIRPQSPIGDVPTHLLFQKYSNFSVGSFQTSEKFRDFISSTKSFLKTKSNVHLDHRPPHSNTKQLRCCKRRPYCLDKCWFGRDDYETLSVEDYLSNQLSQGCCKTKDGGTPLDLTLKERVFSRIRNGFFIESGGQDGVFQSNTLVAEKIFGWSGLLIEPSKVLIETCKLVREPKSKCIHAALVEYNGPEYVTAPSGAPGGKVVRESIPEKVQKHNKVRAYPLSVLLSKLQIKKIDLWSLDIENQEFNALMGLDFSLHRPTYIMVEVWKQNPKIFEKLEREGKFRECRRPLETQYMFKKLSQYLEGGKSSSHSSHSANTHKYFVYIPLPATS